MDMREMIDLVETQTLPSVKAAEALRAEIAQAAQAQYDKWDQDEDGYDEEVGAGGICHLIAEDVASLLYRHEIEAQTVSATHEVHVYVVAAFKEGVFEIDVPHRVYETGGGYTWKKIPDVTIRPDDVTISCLDRNSGNLYMYVDEE